MFNNNTYKLTSFEFDKLMWKNGWDLIFCWTIVIIAFDLNIRNTFDDLQDAARKLYILGLFVNLVITHIMIETSKCRIEQ